MLIKYESSDTDHKIADFIYQKNNEPGSFCHLCPQTRDDISKELARILAKTEPSLLVLRDETNTIHGVFRLFAELAEKYLEMIWGFVREPSAYEDLFEYLRTEYPGFQLDAVVTKENQAMFKAYKAQGIQYDDEQILMTLEGYTPKHVDAAIVRYSPEYEASYHAIHDDEGLYWTAERMLKALDKYSVFVAVENGEAVGYIEMTTGHDENEPIQLLVKPDRRGKGYGRALLQTAIEENMPKRTVLEVYANNTPALNLYLSLGFQEKLREFTGSMTIQEKTMEIKRYTKNRIPDVLQFEKDLRSEENFWGWEIDDKYIADVTRSFEAPAFDNSLSLLAYIDGKVVGRIDSTMICSHFDGSTKAYLDWICVIKSYRHKGVARKLMSALRAELKKQGVNTLIGLIASNEDAQRFYRSLPNSEIKDEGIWIDL